MRNTKIQWTHSAINAVMGCDGCELWPPSSKVRTAILEKLHSETNISVGILKPIVSRAVEDRPTSVIYQDRKSIAAEITAALELAPTISMMVVDVIRDIAKCYAGMQGTMRAGHKGYADQFEIPKLFPGRIAEAARWGLPAQKEVDDKPWIAGLPRLIFVSDMGDALSKSVPFEYLRDEIIKNVISPDGQRHIWLWLTKRPERMAQFAAWLGQGGIEWPKNLMAMTTVTEQTKDGRVDELRKVSAKMRGLSIEPLFGPIKLDLTGIDWVIVGGGSDVLAEPFHVEWAMDLRDQCAKAGVAFFLKQLGKNPFYQGKPIDLENRHGGNWNEWPEEWRIREFPAAFKTLVTLS